MHGAQGDDRVGFRATLCEFENRSLVPADDCVRHPHRSDVIPRRYLKHEVGKRILHDRAQATGAGPACESPASHRTQGLEREDEIDVIQSEERYAPATMAVL